MRRLVGHRFWLHASGSLPLLVALSVSGCGGTGTEATPDSSVATTTPEATPPKASTSTGAGAPEAKGDQADLITPDRRIDTQQAIDVVKEEVKGGEASAGPTPENYLWLPPDEKQIKDEPLEVTVPAGLQPLTTFIPAANPLTKAKVELGKQLYFDPRVSLNGTVSCATCHNPEKGWTDNLKTSVGIDGQVGGRNAPTVINTVYGQSMFWDGRAPSLEGQAQGPIQNPIEMGEQSYKQIIDRLRTISGYREQFQKVFGSDVTLDGLAKAIASFERVAALSGNSPYDKYNAGDTKALSESQKRGMVLFGLRLDSEDEFKTDVTLQKAKCTLCHVGFNFTDEKFHNLGVGWNGQEGRFADLGRFVIEAVGAKSPASYGAFKTPTLRDIVATAPYMHDGSMKTLEEVMDHYDKGGNANPALDKDMTKLDLTAQEKADVIAFMKALSGERPKIELPKLPVGPDGKTPNPADALATPAPKAAWNGAFHPAAG